MLPRRSSRIANRKILKTGGSDEDVASTSSCDPSKSINSDVGESSSAGTNPLQNSVILNHLFKLCSPRTLVSCRLVCKQWYEESLLSFRNASPLKFTVNDDGDIFRDYQYYRKRRTVPLQTFLDTVDPQRLHQGKSYPSIHFRDSKIDFHITKKKQFKIFWNAFGGNLTTLEFYNCTFLDHEEFRQIIFFRCPKLKRLVIDSCEFSLTRNHPIQKLPPLDYKDQPFEQNKHLKALIIAGYRVAQRKLPVSWLELFSHFPLISSLTNDFHFHFIGFDDDDKYDCKLAGDDFDNLTKAIRNLRKRDGRLLPLKFFDIGIIEYPADPLTKQRLQILNELRLPLHRLSVKLQPGFDDVFFKDTFALHAERMIEIKLKGLIPTPSFSQFPYGHQLNNLLKLSVDNSLCKHMAFLNYMPNLEEMTIFGSDSVCPSTMAVSDNYEATHLRMLKLKRLTLHCSLNDDELAYLGDWMPNVSNFCANLDDKQFGIVCKTWKNLKELVVLGHRLTDEGLIGKENETGPNITNLQNLETVAILSRMVTSKSVFHGFWKLPNLRCLKTHYKLYQAFQNGNRKKELQNRRH